MRSPIVIVHPSSRPGKLSAIALAQRYATVRASRPLALAAPLSRRGLRRAVDAGRKPRQVASRAHDLVLRDLRARAVRARTTAPFDPAFTVLFNSYYNAVGDKHPRPAARPAHAARRSRPCATYRAHVDAAMAAAAARSAARRGDADRARLAPRAAAPGADPHRRQAPAVAAIRRSPAYQPALAADTGRATPTRLGLAPRRDSSKIGARGDGFAFDNEAPRHDVLLRPFELASHPVSHGEFAAVHRRRRLPAAGAVAVARLGHGRRAAAGTRRCTGSVATAPGGRSRCTAWCEIDAAHAGHATSACSRPMRTRAGRARGCRPSSNGKRLAADAAGRRQLRRKRRAASARRREPTPLATARAAVRRRLGMDRSRATRRIPAFARPTARSANTTASSCATSTCCAADRCATPQSHIRATLPQFLPAGGALAVLGAAPRARR